MLALPTVWLPISDRPSGRRSVDECHARARAQGPRNVLRG